MSIRSRIIAAAFLAVIACSAEAQTITPQIGGGISFGGIGEGGVSPPPVSGRLPCDIAAAAGTPCVAAHSVTRRMWSGYTGPLFQITRASDSTTQNIGFTATGVVNQAAINTFCAATTCTYSLIYDQMHTAASGNNLPQATAANQAPVTYTTFANSATLPMVQTGAQQFYRNRAATIGIPTGNSSITEYMVSNTVNFSQCCGTYGNMENTVHDDGGGTMFALALTYAPGNTQIGTGSGSWPGVDWENGVFSYGASPAPVLLNTLAKYNAGTTKWALKSDPGLSGKLTTLLAAGTPPDTAAFEGGLSLGEGGDGTPASGAFFEGVVIAGATTDATDNAIAANVASFYGSFGTPTTPKQFVTVDVGQNSLASTAVTLNPLVATPANSLMIAIGFDVSLATGTKGAITDTQSNTWTLANSSNISGVGWLTFFYCWNCKALSTSDTITYTDANSVSIRFDAAYITGVLSSSNPLDAAAAATATATGTVTSGTPVTAGEIFVGVQNCVTPATLQSTGWMTPPFVYNPGTSPGAIVAGVIVNPGLGTETYNPNGTGGCNNAIITPFKHQ